MTNISNIYFLNTEDWKLVPDPFIILNNNNNNNSKIWPFLIVDIYFF